MIAEWTAIEMEGTVPLKKAIAQIARRRWQYQALQSKGENDMSRRDHRNVDKMFAEERRRALQARDLLIEHDHETFLSITEYISEENVPQMLQDTEDEDGYSAADHLLDGKFDVARKMLLDKYGAHFG